MASFLVFVLAGGRTLLSVEFAPLPVLQWYMAVSATVNALYFYYLNAVAEFTDELPSKSDWRHYLFTLFQYTLIYSMWFGIQWGGLLGYTLSLVLVYLTYLLYDGWHYDAVRNDKRIAWMAVFDSCGFVLAIIFFILHLRMPVAFTPKDINFIVWFTSALFPVTLIPIVGVVYSRWTFKYELIGALRRSLRT